MAGIPQDICHLDSAAFSRFGLKLSLSGTAWAEPSRMIKCPSDCWLTVFVCTTTLSTHLEGIQLSPFNHACAHAYVCACMHVCMHACMDANILTCT